MHLNAKEYDVDDVLAEVGQWGRSQQRLFLYFNLQHVLLGLVVISIIFIGVEPSWKCRVEPVTSPGTAQGSHKLESRSLLDIEDDDKCVMYERQSCVVEVDEPYSSIVTEVRVLCIISLVLPMLNAPTLLKVTFSYSVIKLSV